MRAVKTGPDGRIRYRLRFDGRPDLNSDHFDSERAYAKGDHLAEPGTFEHGDWRVREVVPGDQDEPDTLLLEPAG
jgi:hypothetical protein